MPILMYHLKHFGLLQQFSECTSGFIDTYKVAFKVYSKAAVGNFKQETLVKHFLDKDYDAHNALSDVLSLRELYEKVFSEKCQSSDIFTLNFYAVKSSLVPLVDSKVISPLISRRLLACNLGLNTQKTIHKRDPHNGIHNVFSEVIGDSKTPRITKCKKSLRNLFSI